MDDISHILFTQKWGAKQMNIVYYCKHCKTFMGMLDGPQADTATKGFLILTPEERSDMIHYNELDQTTYVKTVCEYCEAALRQNPELMLEQTPLQ